MWCRLALAALLSLPASATSVAATLGEVLVQTYLDNPRLRAGQASLRALDESVAQALSGWRPSITASSAQAFDQTQTNDSDVMLDTRRAGLSLVQPLYTGGETVAGTSRAENAVRAGRSRLVALEQQVLLDAIDAYASMAREQAVLDLARQNEARLLAQLEAARQRYRLGEITRTDVAQAETRRARAQAERVQAEGTLATAAAAYRRIVGRAPDQLAPAEPPADLPASLAEALELVEAHPEVAAARFDLETARDDTDLAMSGLKPRITLNGEMSYVDQPSTLLNWQSNLSIGATLSVPLYQGGGEYARVRQAKQAAQQRRWDLDEIRRRAEERITGAWEARSSAQARITALELQSDRAAFALDGVKREALVGARTVLDVLDAEQELFTADVELVRGRRDELVAGYQLRAAIGTLTVTGLGLDVAPYDPETHYLEVRDKLFGLGED